MAHDVKKDARALIDGALAKQRKLGYRPSVPKTSYDRAVRRAESVFRSMEQAAKPTKETRT
jgi:hypothetical protein